MVLAVGVASSPALEILKASRETKMVGPAMVTDPPSATDIIDSIITTNLIHSLPSLFHGNGIPDGIFVSAELTDGGRSVFGGDHIRLSGGDQKDWLQTHDHSFLDGGGGDDLVNAGAYSEAYGGDGEDWVSTTRFGHSYGGSGDDRVTTGYMGEAYGGTGDDEVIVSGGKAYGENGDDAILLHTSWEDMPDNVQPAKGIGSVGYGGSGDDTIVAHGWNHTAVGGEGDDTIDLSQARNTAVKYATGDGKDTILVADTFNAKIDKIKEEMGVLQRDGPSTRGNNNRLELGPYLNEENTHFSVDGNELTITFDKRESDEITVKFYDQTDFTVAFQDGTEVKFLQSVSGDVLKMSDDGRAQALAYLEF